MNSRKKNPLTQVRELIRNPVRRVRIVRLTNSLYWKGTKDANEIIRSCDISTATNRGKKRKNGEAKISHMRDMFVIMSKHCGIVNSILAKSIFSHDDYEDYPKEWPLYRIEEEFGLEVRKIVRAVSKPPLNGRELVSAEFSQAVANRVRKGGELAMILKVIDRFHFFLKPFPGHDRRKLVWKVVQTMQHIQQMALELGVLAVELELIVAECILKNRITNEELREFV